MPRIGEREVELVPVLAVVGAHALDAELMGAKQPC